MERHDMNPKTARLNLETLARLLEADGWGAHYIEALRIGAESLSATEAK